MRLQSISPPPSISNYVHEIVVLEDNNLPGDMLLPLIAKGYPNIVFQTTGSRLLCPANYKTDNLVLNGQNIKPFELRLTEKVTIIAYFLYPNLLKPFFGFDACEATERSIDLSHLPPAKDINLKEQLLNAKSLHTRLQLMNHYVSKLSQCIYASGNPITLFAIREIQKNKGLISLKRIRDEFSVSERMLQRLFESHVGVSPKQFCKICQFHSAHQQLNQMQFSKLSDIAYENGYADQSHLIRVFKEFTNRSPGDYLKNTPEIHS